MCCSVSGMDLHLFRLVVLDVLWFSFAESKSCYDGTIAAEKYHGILYPNQTKIADTYSFCLSMCSVDQSCIALHYDRQSMQCHLSSLPLVYMLPYDVDEEFRTARVKNVAIHQLQVASYQDLAGGSNWDTSDNSQAVSDHPITHLHDQSVSTFFMSREFLVTESHVGFKVNLPRVYKVIGFELYACSTISQLAGLSVFTTSTSFNQYFKLCYRFNQATVEGQWNYYPCSSGTLVGHGLATEHYYQLARKMKFKYWDTQLAGRERFCINELRIYGYGI